MADAKRIEWIDVCKAWGIFLVIVGHVLSNVDWVVYIYSFHMPLFFFLSGYVFSTEKYNIKSFLKSRVNSLVIPYVFFYLVTLAVYWFFEAPYRNISYTFYDSLKGMFVGAQINHLMDHNGILWFLPCLFCTEVIGYFVCKIRNVYSKFTILVGIVILGFLILSPLPWSLNISFVALQFFIVGNTIKNAECKLDTFMGGGNKYLLILSFLLQIYFFPNFVNMATCDYGNIFLFEIGSYLGIFSTIVIVRHITLFVRWRFLLKIGRNTMIIFALHQILIRACVFLCAKLAPYCEVQRSLLCAVIIAIFIIAVMYPLFDLYKWFSNNFIKKIYLR